ncbi:HEXXH motif-containing putative peptide modification protein [Streptomyces sp. NPDC006385]|uniref:HEXXH motif domain-containing protein n=1 Tax=Streptomyces sp. NPDC006385 TaxID=3156761 RepID=UPI0033BDD2AF
MTGEQPPPTLRVPDRLFAELATGGGSSEALACLERGERARRLLLLRTALAHIDARDARDAAPSPVGAPADAWRVLKAVAGQAPDVVEDLLLAPQTGGWLAHLLRRVHHTASGPPLWAETGHLNVLAVTAALRADLESDLLVPLVDGALVLPGLGLARLPDSRRGHSVGRAATKAGELTLTSVDGEACLVCRPRTVPATGCAAPPAVAVPEAAAAHWVPLRTLSPNGSADAAAIPLDDLGPYRDLDEPIAPDRLDADEAVAWQKLFDDAVGILAVRSEPGPGRLDPALIRTIVPWGRTAATPTPPPVVELSASTGDAFGSMMITRPATGLALAEALVHEFQHSKLGALLHLFPLLDDDREERYYAPWRSDPRHLTGCLHGAYAFTGVAGFWRDRMAEPEHAGAAAYHFALRRAQARLVVRTLLTSGRLTAPGRRLVTGLAGTLDGWLREPVAPEALARARTAAALHRTEWRLRNVVAAEDGAAGDGGPAPLRFRPDRVLWADRRTHAFAVPPAAPRTADDHLAAGDPATALARYAEALAHDPGDAHLLAGWIVARAALGNDRPARRLLARPELVQVGLTDTDFGLRDPS